MWLRGWATGLKKINLIILSLKSHSDQQLDLFQIHSLWFNSSAALVGRQLVHLLSVGILNLSIIISLFL